MSNVIATEFTRFKSVVDARKTPRELLELFDKLLVSDKFSEEAKPECFGILIGACAEKLLAQHIPLLLDAIGRTSAITRMRMDLPAPAVDLIAALVVRRAFLDAKMDSDSLVDVFTHLETTGVVADRCHALGLACQSGLPMDVIDAICDLTFEAHYGTGWIKERTKKAA